MKLKKAFISFAIIFGLLFASNVVADTTAPNSFDVNGRDTYLINGAKWLNGRALSLHYKQKTDGTVIYCTQIHKNAVIGNVVQKFTLSKELDAKYAYVIANGYPNKNMTGDKNKDYYITALAIWYLSEPNDAVFHNFDFNNGTYNGAANDVAREVGKLIKGANSYSYTQPTMKISLSSDNLTLSSDKKYYLSTSIGVTTTGTVGKYTVSLENAPKGTIVIDSKGNVKNEFTTSEKFVVKVPVSSISSLSSEFKVNVKATGSLNKAYLYTTGKSYYQNVAALYPENKSLSVSTDLKINVNTEVQISKVDATTSKELAGATLIVKDSNGSEVDKWVSTNEVHVIKGLKPGKYTLTEVIAPEGYKLSTETVTFEIKVDGSVNKVVMKNEPIITVVQISKVDATTGKELAGATLIVKDSNGNEVDKWISTNEVHVIKGLKPGKYTLTEVIAPEGYKLSTETVTFEVKTDGSVNKVVMKNELEEKKNIYISKQDITTGEELAGAHLELKDEDGNLIEAWVSEDTPHMVLELKPGKYYLTETLAPEGYELSTETVEFIVKEDKTVDGDIIMYNKPETIVEVPSTSSFKTITSFLIGVIVIGLGSMIIYRNYKKNEEY